MYVTQEMLSEKKSLNDLISEDKIEDLLEHIHAMPDGWNVSQLSEQFQLANRARKENASWEVSICIIDKLQNM